MDDIITNLKRSFQTGSILKKLIFINVAVFILIRLLGVLLLLFNLQDFPLLLYLQLPASPMTLLSRP